MAESKVSTGGGDKTGAVARSAGLSFSAVEESADEAGEPVEVVAEDDGDVVNLCEDACGSNGTEAVGGLFTGIPAPVLNPACKFSP